MDAIFIYVIMVNAVALLMYGIDKWNAKYDHRRIPEKTLLGIAVIGGSIGAYVGMRLFHHKTRKPKFYIGIPLIFAMQMGILMYIYH